MNLGVFVQISHMGYLGGSVNPLYVMSEPTILGRMAFVKCN